MRTKPRTIVGDLAEWELPLLDDRLCDLIEELKPKRLSLKVDEATFGDLLEGALYERVRALGATAANEAILGWLEGVADGCPELCTEFPHLKTEDAAEPLTILYSIGAEDGSRAEINRIDFEGELTDAVASIEPVSERQRSAARLALRLRGLADELEAGS